jgi:hypothetical protein
MCTFCTKFISMTTLVNVQYTYEIRHPNAFSINLDMVLVIFSKSRKCDLSHLTVPPFALTYTIGNA